MRSKIDTTILAIIYHPEIRDVLTDNGKKDIAKMVRVLSDELQPKDICRFIKCIFTDRCTGLCDWGASNSEIKKETV